MIFSKKLNKINYPILYLDNKPLKQVSNHCQLGITFTDDMSWNEHITSICEKAGKRISAMLRISNRLNKETKLNLCSSFIRPILEYGCVIFDNSSKKMPC